MAAVDQIKHPPVATTAPPFSLTRRATACASPVTRGKLGSIVPICTPAAPPAATKRVAASTATPSAFEGSCPSASGYCERLQPFLANFPDSHIAVIDHHDLQCHTARTVGALYAWLGVDPKVRPPGLGVRLNVADGGDPIVGTDVRRRFARLVADDVERFDAVHKRLVLVGPTGTLNPATYDHVDEELTHRRCCVMTRAAREKPYIEETTLVVDNGS